VRDLPRHCHPDIVSPQSFGSPLITEPRYFSDPATTYKRPSLSSSLQMYQSRLPRHLEQYRVCTGVLQLNRQGPQERAVRQLNERFGERSKSRNTGL
jgi:hypothetical protein